MADVREPAQSYDAIVVAGGRSSRLGSGAGTGTGTDKTRLEIDGMPLLDRVLAAVADARQRVVVGEPRTVGAAVVWAREEPTGGGPAAGVVAGLQSATAPVVLLLAADLPRLDAATVRRLRDAIGAGAGGPYDGAILVDATGRRQHLTCAVVTEALRRAARTRSSWHDAAMHEFLAPLRLRPVAVQGREADDIDTPEDLSATIRPPTRIVADNSTEEGA